MLKALGFVLRSQRGAGDPFLSLFSTSEGPVRRGRHRLAPAPAPAALVPLGAGGRERQVQPSPSASLPSTSFCFCVFLKEFSVYVSLWAVKSLMNLEYPISRKI